jgi:hypothetical protein
MKTLTKEIQMRTINRLNREGWKPRLARASRNRGTVWAEMRYEFGQPVFLSPLTIKIARIAPRELTEHGLESALVSVKTGIADWLTIDDGDPRLTWEYAQERGKPKQYAIRIEVAPR